MIDARFTVAGIQISISFWFAALITLYALVFENSLKVLLAVVLHETAHILAIYILGAHISSIGLRISDIKVVSDISSLSDAGKLAVSASGPAANVLGALFAWIWNDMSFVAINSVICIFQLIPSEGSDGGEILKTLTGNRYPKLNRVISCIVSTMLIFAGALMLVMTGYNLSLLIAGSYLLFMTCKEGI